MFTKMVAEDVASLAITVTGPVQSKVNVTLNTSGTQRLHLNLYLLVSAATRPHMNVGLLALVNTRYLGTPAAGLQKHKGTSYRLCVKDVLPSEEENKRKGLISS